MGSFFTELKSNAIILIVLEVQLLFSAGKGTTLYNTIQEKSVNDLDTGYAVRDTPSFYHLYVPKRSFAYT